MLLPLNMWQECYVKGPFHVNHREVNMNLSDYCTVRTTKNWQVIANKGEINKAGSQCYTQSIIRQRQRGRKVDHVTIKSQNKKERFSSPSHQQSRRSQ